MLAARQRLSHWICHSPPNHVHHLGCRLILPCLFNRYMSPARLISSSPERSKRRRLSTTSAVALNSSSPKMAPALIQEVDDEPEEPQQLELTEVESTLRRLLLDVAAYVDHHPAEIESQVKLPEDLAKQPIVLRFTGGWVRDKLLGVQSHDIDVAINKMTGYQFGLKLKDYLEIPGNPEKYGLEGVATTDKQSQKAGTTDKSKTVGGLHKIEANPEKSKHLETVTTKILGLDIDLVNLRKETYTDDSRNPQMEFGTPEEDALRRDATINAMFYNINTKEIEDLTGQGHNDLERKLIRTPLEPYQTFKDDPLRILRLIRFASRLGYTIDARALKAMREEDIKDALRRKISRERVGVELEKALRGADPHEALRLIFDLDLYDTVFSDPTVEAVEHYKPETEAWQTIIDTLQDIIRDGRTLAEILLRDDDDNYLAYQLAALVPYRNAPELPSPAPGRKAPPPIPVLVAREGIKATNKVSDIILAAVRNQAEISGLVDRYNEQQRKPNVPSGGEDMTARDTLGMAIRRWGASWRSQVVYAFLVDLAENPGSVDAIERRYTGFLNHLQKLDILEAYSLKPLLDGKALAKALSTGPGPWMKDALDVVMAWQLRNPGITAPEAAIEEVKEKRGELTSALVHHFLKLTIRPLFAKARPVKLTDTARKAIGAPLPQRINADSMNESETKPWKSEKDSHALNLLKWVMSALDERLAERDWPMVVPPVLTLVDEWETKYKHIGVEMLTSLLKVTSPALLERTGLGEVFEQALMPCLTYLPTITPVDKSVELLSAVYPALLALAHVRYPDSLTSTKSSTADLQRQRIKLLDSIVRKGIIYGYSVCSQYPRITKMLFDQLVLVFNELGIDSVKHLKYVLPILTEVLSHPIGHAHDASLMSATQALQAVILNGWPRMPGHRGEVLKGVTFCWLHLTKQGDGSQGQAIKAELRTTVRILRSALGNESGFDGECEMLVAADGRLEELFTIPQQ